MGTNYYKRHWNESTGDPVTDSWGHSIFYFETADDLYPSKQIQIFENGNILKYNESNPDDKFGGLSDQPLDIKEFNEFRIEKAEFDKLWQSSSATTT